jgi:hypothetical protein
MSNRFLDPPLASSRDKAAFELLRVWVAEEGQHVNLRSGTWEDPFAWGIVLADLARHIVNAESMHRKGLDKDDFLARMLEGFQSGNRVAYGRGRGRNHAVTVAT